MKKTKVIIPAMGILVLSTAAAVTGTVAWFTASRVKSLTMSNITVYNPESGLEMTVANVANTTVTPATDSTPANVEHSALRDASVDMSQATPAVWASILDDSGEVSGFRSVASPYAAGTVSGTNIFYATAFEVKFNLTATTGYNFELFFDAEESLNTVTALTAGTNDVLSALRIGIKTSSNYVVWAPRTVDAGVKKITAANTAAAGVTESKAIIGDANTLPATTNDVLNSGYNSNAAYLGQVPFKVQSGEQTYLSATVYTWFEGTDSKCIPSSKGIETAFAAGLTFKMFRSN